MLNLFQHSSGWSAEREGKWTLKQVQRDALRQTEKLDPQPQPEAALGLVTLNAEPPKSST